jgi:hypothetical protein
MRSRRPYKLVYDIGVLRHLARIDRTHHAPIREEIERALLYEPTRKTRNRKPLTRPSALGSAWELRCGPGNCFRIFYRTDRDAREVRILAIGIKERDRLSVGGEEFPL